MSTPKDTTATKQSLGRADLMSLAVGQIIGVGIMSMTGVAIGMTGRSVNLAFIIAGVITVFSAVPQILIGGTARFFGGQYSQIAYLGGQRLAGIYTIINISTAFAFSMFTISFTDYLSSLLPGTPVRLVSFITLAILFGLHLVGVKQAARLQNIMCIILALALTSFVIFGIGKVQPGYFAGPDFMTGGLPGLCLASVFLSFAAGGATYVVNYSDVAKNPTKDIPFVIAAATIGVVAIYALMATIASGVLPVAEVANKPLSVVAKSFMPSTVFSFFVVGGAMFALLTTLNFSIGAMCAPARQAAIDGWLPKFFTVQNKKYGSYHWTLLFFFLFALVPILLGLDLSTVANSTVILTTTIRGIIAFSAMRLPNKMPEVWKQSKFHIGNTALYAICIITMVLAAVSVCLLIFTTSLPQIIGNIVILLIAVVVAFVRNSHVHLAPSFEEK